MMLIKHDNVKSIQFLIMEILKLLKIIKDLKLFELYSTLLLIIRDSDR